MAKLRDLTGKRFGRLTVISHFDQDKFGHHRWLCRCDCGNEKVITGSDLTRKRTRTTSCGCYFLEWKSERNKKHGDSRTRLYGIWFNMLRRCRDPRVSEFRHYGARGITVCGEWVDYPHFKQWAMSNGYQDNLTIERLDVNENYCPENCKWIPMLEQAKNKTTSVKYMGKIQADWARELGVSVNSLCNYRKYHKCSLEDAVKHFQKLL